MRGAGRAEFLARQGVVRPVFRENSVDRLLGVHVRFGGEVRGALARRTWCLP